MSGSFQQRWPQVGEGWLQMSVSLYCLPIFPFSPKRLWKAPAPCKLGKVPSTFFLNSLDTWIKETKKL